MIADSAVRWSAGCRGARRAGTPRRRSWCRRCVARWAAPGGVCGRVEDQAQAAFTRIQGPNASRWYNVGRRHYLQSNDYQRPPMNRRKFLQWGSLASASLVLGCQSRSPRPPSAIPWNDLASGLDGKVVLPGSGDYESSYPTFIKRFDNIRPAGVVIAENEADVVEAVRFAKQYGIHAVARSGGHSFGGYSTTEGMVIDLKRLAAVQVADQRASVGGGA